MNQRVAVMVMSLVAAAAGGCGKGKDGAGGGATGGASCADAAANFVAHQAADTYGKLGRIAPTPEQLKALTAMVQGHCETGAFEGMTGKPWSAATRTCVAAAKPPATPGADDPATECLRKQAKGYSLGVLQIVHVFVEAEKAKAPAAPPPPPPAPPPAEPAAGSGSAPAAP